MALFIAAVALVAMPASAQEDGPGPGTVELTIIPGGGLLFTGSDSESRFRNYGVGGSLTVNINRYIGFEGDASVALGVYHQNVSLSGVALSEAPPNLVDYSGNITFSAPGGTHHTVPYAVGGIGSLMVLRHDDLGIGSSKAFLTGNAGGGLKWYANGRWGLRADYRFVMVRSSNAAPAFFGREGRFAHRIYGGIILNLVE
jgi:hypothetical protein